MNQRMRGFTLIELMIVVAIIGILASLALASYRTYTIRAQISEGLEMAAGAKVPVVEAYNSDGVAPADRAAAGMTPDPTDTSGSYVKAVAITDGRIDIIFGGPMANQAIVDKTLSLTPYITDGNSVTWRCGTAGVPAGGSLLDGGADHLAPTVEATYLPGACR